MSENKKEELKIKENKKEEIKIKRPEPSNIRLLNESYMPDLSKIKKHNDSK
ncbi:MAG: hypothetical protein ACRC3I_10550 [Cetobacterium sp.]